MTPDADGVPDNRCGSTSWQARHLMTYAIFAMRRPRAVAIHFAASAFVAVWVAALVFHVWYPGHYAAIAGGAALFTLVVGVDVVLGPLLTAVIASPDKSSAELRRDLVVIVLLQLAGLGYGLYVMAQARPVYVSFEIDRFRVVTAADIDPALLAEAPVALRSLPWTGPKLISAVKPADPGEQMRSVELGLAGIDLSMIPRNWRDYGTQADAVWRAAKPVSALSMRYPPVTPRLAEIASTARQDVQSLRYLPLVSRQSSWVALVAMPGARVVGQLPVDGFQ